MCMCPEALDHYGGGVRDGFELSDWVQRIKFISGRSMCADLAKLFFGGGGGEEVDNSAVKHLDLVSNTHTLARNHS